MSKLSSFIDLPRKFTNWPTALVDHLGLLRWPYTSQLRNGISIQTRPANDDRHIIFEVFVKRIYDYPIFPNDTVVDIGAHIGCFTLWAAKQGAEVYSYEPFPENYEHLSENVELNDLGTIHIANVAVGGERGTRSMYIPSNSAHSGRHSLFAGRGKQTVEVECITLANVFERHDLDRIDYLKLDCQGAEYEILYNAPPTVLDLVQTIIVECEYDPTKPEWSTQSMNTFLRDRNFRTIADGNIIYAAR